MNTPLEDYLWDPTATPDAEIEWLERALEPLGARALGMGQRSISLVKRSRWNNWKYFVAVAAAASFVVAALTGLYIYRLSWDEKSPWSMTIARSDGSREDTLLHVGESIITGSGQSATLDVARIGTVVIASNSNAKLIRTESNRHRLELERGQIHAKIWAPPNYFGVNHGDASFIDMGCEFDLRVDAPHTGVLTVQSGWVFYTVGYEDVLVPEHYSLIFNEARAQLPVRTEASDEFRQWVNELDAGAEPAPAGELARSIAEAAQDEDAFTLDTLLRHRPELAAGPLYDRLAKALNAKPSEEHRKRWVSGDRDAINEWWRLWPKRPKEWWVNWRDAL